MDTKINQILKQWPKGFIATASWLLKHNISRQLARCYVESGWLCPFGHGAFIRAGDSPDWLSGLHTLQQQAGMSAYAAAQTALSLKELGHFLPLSGNAELCLFSERRESFPSWFVKHEWNMRIRRVCPNLFEPADPAGFTRLDRDGLSVRIAAPERAILEVLYLAADNSAIDHAVNLMEGLNTLRPQTVQRLLENCGSIRVKRLFLWAAESAGHEWLKRIDVSRLELGKGKRSVYRGGHFNAKYQITTPKQEGASDV